MHDRVLWQEFIPDEKYIPSNDQMRDDRILPQEMLEDDVFIFEDQDSIEQILLNSKAPYG